MSSVDPSADDYLMLFQKYAGVGHGRDFGQLYLEPNDERFRLLFEQICHLLVKPSRYNLEMPQEFRRTAHAYLGGDSVVVVHMRAPEMRHFMLSDLYDYVALSHRLGHGFS